MSTPVQQQTLESDSELDEIRGLLDAWNVECDRFREAAALALKGGEVPSTSLIEALEYAHDGLIGLIELTDQMLGELPGGHPDFAQLLQAQGVAISLLESVSNSYDVLDRFISKPVADAKTIGREMRIAAE